MINGYDKLYYLLINNTTIQQITNKTDNEEVFTYFEIINKSYENLFRENQEGGNIREGIMSYEEPIL